MSASNGKMRPSRSFTKRRVVMIANFRGNSLVAHAGKVLLELVPSRLGNYCEQGESLHEEL